MTKSQAEIRQRQHIEAARELLKPSPVRHHHVPDWLRRRCLKRFGTGGNGDTSGWHVIHHAVEQVVDGRSRHWLDHFGSTTIGDRRAFAIEPYNLTRPCLADVFRLGDELGLDVEIDANSWWYPGRTIRVLFFEPTEGNQ